MCWYFWSVLFQNSELCLFHCKAFCIVRAYGIFVSLFLYIFFVISGILASVEWTRSLNPRKRQYSISFISLVVYIIQENNHLRDFLYCNEVSLKKSVLSLYWRSNEIIEAKNLASLVVVTLKHALKSLEVGIVQLCDRMLDSKKLW